tara:strand:- start:45 stop:221 length:177 start_codon:yes stop_codon:yes gene_type:complete
LVESVEVDSSLVEVVDSKPVAAVEETVGSSPVVVVPVGDSSPAVVVVVPVVGSSLVVE